MQIIIRISQSAYCGSQIAEKNLIGNVNVQFITENKMESLNDIRGIIICKLYNIYVFL